jgi:leukotriene-A4 hydrolase
MTPIPQDIHTYAQPNIARVTHVALDLTADFAGKSLFGTATLDIAAQPGATEIVLDARNLDIRSITDSNGQALRFTEGRDDPILGHALTVQIGEARKIVITYATRPDAAALQWLTPAQTAGRSSALYVQPGPGHPDPDMGPDPGQPRHPPDLGRDHHSSLRPGRGDVRREPDAQR